MTPIITYLRLEVPSHNNSILGDLQAITPVDIKNIQNLQSGAQIPSLVIE